ncbi:uncharacterized protein M421DRAFT_97335 [Didymella exigua CBS 183.55]|uniref:Uncharacterized protein n=1 Tax=Didymella exigua CBS 183.55 TaxID=1150837 RepID=A0A6A5S1B2_9PLEO|nr:uncharacterized protein M421DRAFT_97335 [Didymella exigua CBS 183.55]KAF1934431.1 hypothetical protein M421DRAFT_97335 [Didymella exigua CBS 183.55]
MPPATILKRLAQSPAAKSVHIDTPGFACADDLEGAAFVEQFRKDEEGAKERYYEHLQSLLKKYTGASRVVIFDYTMCRRVPSLAGKNSDGREQPAAYVHVDQSNKHVHQHLGDEAECVLKRRDWPLATMDFTSLKPENYHPTNLYRKQFELVGQSCNISHHEDQRCAFEHPDTPEDAPLRESIEVRCIVCHEHEDPAPA